MADALQQSLIDQENRKREIIRLALLDEFNKGMEKGLSQSKIDSNLSTLKRILEKQYDIPFSMANGGAVGSDESFNEMRASLENALENMSDEEFESAYGQSKSAAREVLDMLIVQRYHGASYEDGVPSSYRLERDAQLALESKMPEEPPEAAMSSTTGMVGADAEGNLVEYGVGSLNETASNMFRGPRGLESLSRFAEGGDVSSYREALIASESSGRTSAENPSGAVGLTQAMPDTLKDFKRDTGLEFTDEEYKNSRDLQTKFQDWYEQKTINYIMDQGLDRFIGQTIKGVPITMSAMLGMAHLGGDYGMRKFLETGGRYDPDDGYTKLSDYGRKFSNLSIVGQGDVGLEPSPEEILMSMPVEQEAEFTDPRSYSRIPQLRPEFMPTAPMPRPRLRPDAQEAVETEVEEALIRRARPSMVEKYGLPGDMPAGIGSLNTVAKNMYS